MQTFTAWDFYIYYAIIPTSIFFIGRLYYFSLARKIGCKPNGAKCIIHDRIFGSKICFFSIILCGINPFLFYLKYGDHFDSRLEILPWAIVTIILLVFTFLTFTVFGEIQNALDAGRDKDSREFIFYEKIINVGSYFLYFLSLFIVIILISKLFGV